MLVLSRKTGEQIQIGNDITIEVRRVSGNRVALAVQAPRDVRILRGELKDVAVEFELDDAGPISLMLHDADCRVAASA
jgi:carbon storage regulator